MFKSAGDTSTSIAQPKLKLLSISVPLVIRPIGDGVTEPSAETSMQERRPTATTTSLQLPVYVDGATDTSAETSMKNSPTATSTSSQLPVISYHDGAGMANAFSRNT